MSFYELSVILLVGFLVLGPKDLLSLAKTAMKVIRKLRTAWHDLERKLCEDDL